MVEYILKNQYKFSETKQLIMKEIERLRLYAKKGETFFPTKTYEDGVMATLEWIIGVGESPMSRTPNIEEDE